MWGCRDQQPKSGWFTAGVGGREGREKGGKTKKKSNIVVPVIFPIFEICSLPRKKRK